MKFTFIAVYRPGQKKSIATHSKIQIPIDHRALPFIRSLIEAADDGCSGKENRDLLSEALDSPPLNASTPAAKSGLGGP